MYERKIIYVKLNFQPITFLNAIRCMYRRLNFRALVTEDHDNVDDNNNNNSATRKNRKNNINSRSN